jgi:hypothetical protein
MILIDCCYHFVLYNDGWDLALMNDDLGLDML